MLDHNLFKKQVKSWIKQNPEAKEQDFVDYCEELIPPNQFASYRWLVEQTTSWYKHVLSNRETAKQYKFDEEDSE